MSSNIESLSRQDIVFVLDNIQDYQSIVDGIDENATVIILNSRKNALEQMASLLNGLGDIDSIHLISHGFEGGINLGNISLANDNLNDYSDTLAKIGSALKEDGDLLLYGCNSAKGEDGKLFVDTLAKITKADVAASDDLTGSASFGGDWALEYSSGYIGAQALSSFLFNGVLVYNGIINFDTVANSPINPADNYTGSLTADVGGYTLQASTGTLVDSGDSNYVGIGDDLADGSNIAYFERVGTATIQFSGGELFNATSLFLISYSRTSGANSREYTITGYNGATTVGSTNATIANIDGGTRSTGSTVNLGWNNITKIVIAPTSTSYHYGNNATPTGMASTFYIDDLVVTNVHAASANVAPTLTTMSNITSATEDTEKAISFADLTTAGDEADSDGTVTSFVVKDVSTGTLNAIKLRNKPKKIIALI